MNQDITLSLLTYYDISQINEISYHFWQEDGIYPLSELLRLLKSNLSYGFKIKNELVAFCLIDRSVASAQIYLFAVKHTYHRMGFGKKLLKWCISNANLEGISKFSLHVAVNNEAAIKLYKSVGFENIQLIKGYYYNGKNKADDNDGYKMELSLLSTPEMNIKETLCNDKLIEYELDSH